jgi:hypothetical protein
MRVLFSAMTPAYLKNFESVVVGLAERGHDVHLAVHSSTKAAGATALDDQLSARSERITTGRAPAPRDDAWHDLALALRSCRDYLQFLRPEFHDPYRARAEVRVPAWFKETADRRLARHPAGRRAMTAVIPLLERAVPTPPELRAYFAELRPDVALFTPYIGLRTVQPDYLVAAQELGIPTVACITSWDNLSSKSLMRPLPDLVTVWNEIQRREAVELHGVAPERVIVTGAQCFDEWFDWQARPREEFCRRVGLDPARPYVLYTCFSPFKGAPSEAEFVADWLAALRASDDATLRDAGVLVRPHPKRGDQWRDIDFSGFGDVVVWPREGEMVVDQEAKADFHDSIHHSAAVVGINTSAMIEAGIVGRPVHTVLEPRFWSSQEGTLHFRYLREVGGGLLRVGRDMDEHLRLLAGSLHTNGRPDAQAEAFVREFIRPHGVDAAATPRFLDAVEEAAARRRPARRPSPALRALRPLLEPLAERERAERLKEEQRQRDKQRRARAKEAERERARADDKQRRTASKLARQASKRARREGLAGARIVRLASWLGLALGALAALGAAGAAAALVAGEDVPGWTVVGLLVCLVGGVQLLTVSLMAQYVGRIDGEMRARVARPAPPPDDDEDEDG